MLASRATRLGAIALAALGWLLVATPGAALAWAWPADGAVLRGYSLGDDPYAGGQHRGIDVALAGSDAVRAPASGEVSFAGQVPTHGTTVTIVTADGYKASLTHLGPLLVKRGARVAEGDPVAEAGPSGVPEHDVPYVHLGVRTGDGDTYVDPLSLLPPRAASPPPAPAAPPAPVPDAGTALRSLRRRPSRLPRRRPWRRPSPLHVQLPRSGSGARSRLRSGGAEPGARGSRDRDGAVRRGGSCGRRAVTRRLEREPRRGALARRYRSGRSA